MSNVTVVLATSAGARHLPRQLASLAEQSYAPVELIVFDDGSDDETLAVLEAFRARAPFPVVLHGNPDEPASAENLLTAALAATTRYVAFSHQGDIWHADKLSRCVAVLEREEALLCAHTATLMDDQSNYTGFLSQGIKRGKVHPPLSLPPFESFGGFSMVFRRDLLDLIPAGARGVDTMGPAGARSPEQWVYFLATSLGVTVTLAHPLVAHRRIVPGHNARPSGAGLVQQMAAALQRAQLMSDLSHVPSGPFAAQAAQAAHSWRLIGETFAARASIHASPSLRARLAQLEQLRRRGVYASRGGLGSKIFMRDAASTLIRLPSRASLGKATGSDRPLVAEDKR